ncbi:MAG: 16S rRNA processing protein RimM [Atopobiaceae bacterium]|nr:16S rRNA processing protein RimM [Atopobiaceae bacterium]
MEKTHGRRGEVVTVPVHGLPPLLREGLRVAVVPPALKGDRWHTVQEVTTGGSGQLVRLTGLDDIAAAQALVGGQLLADVDDLPQGWEAHDVDALLGRAVIDVASGLEGTILAVMTGPANDVWEIRLYKGTIEAPETLYDYLVPVIDSVILELPACGPIRLSVPQGLEPQHTEHLVPEGANTDYEADL